MVSPAFRPGAFLHHAANLVVRHFWGPTPVPVRPSRRSLPSTPAIPLHMVPSVSRAFLREPEPRPAHTNNHPRRRKYRAHRLTRSKSRLIEPAVKKAIRTERRRREATMDILLRKQQAAWRRHGPKDPEEAIVWTQFEALQFDKLKRTAIAEQQAISDRVKANAEQRQAEMAHRDDLADQILRMAALRKEERKDKVRKAREERAARHERMIKKRQAAERAKREDKERSEREARELLVQQLRERAEELAREQAEQKAKMAAERLRQAEEIRLQTEERERARREKLERRKREDEEKQRAYEESVRKLREAVHNCSATSVRLHAQTDDQFQLYSRKWDVLKTGVDVDGSEIPPLVFSQIPWPILLVHPSRPEDITRERIEEFMFHPLRKGGDKKTKRSIIRQEMVRWHPDKFNMTVLVKVKVEELDAVAQGAGEVARLFNAIMDELV